MKRILKQVAIAFAIGPWALACLGVATLFCGGCLAQDGERPPLTAAEVMLRQALARETRRQRPIEFYGRVVDQNGEPVAGAAAECQIIAVQTSILDTSEHKKVTQKTDADGRFSVKAPKGLCLDVLGINAKGYAYDRRDNPFSFVFALQDPGGPPHHPDKKKPVRFLMRRRGEQALLFGGMVAETIEQPPAEHPFGSPVNIAVVCAYGGLPKRGRRPDLTFTAVPGEEEDTFRVTFTAQGKTVFQHSDEKLFLAPEDGYDEKTWTITVPKDHDRHKRTYLYVKSDAPPLYTRAEIEIRPKDDRVRIVARWRTNPYGDRRLEQLSEEDITQAYPGLRMYELISELKKRALPAWRKGRVAEKPDIDALIKANRKKFFWK
jgi:hypothetical protein